MNDVETSTSTNIVNDTTSSIDSGDEVEKRQFNKFELLDLVEDETDNNNDTDDCSQNKPTESEDEKLHTKPRQSKVKRKNRKKGSNVTVVDEVETTHTNVNKNLEKRLKSRRRGKGRKGHGGPGGKGGNANAFDELIEEQLRIIGSSDTKTSSGPNSSTLTDAERALMRRLDMLTVEHRNLNPDNELRRMFGRKIIDSERATRVQRRAGRSTGVSSRNSASLVGDEDRIPTSRTGLIMILDDELNREYNTSQNKDNNNKSDTLLKGIQYFRFVHSKNYQQTHNRFLDAAEQGDTAEILRILTPGEPLHVESLIQLSDVVRESEDYKTASEFIQQALAIIQNSFHTSFNMTQARCRLDYRRPENRSFFIALFKHLNYLGRRGLKRTPLEFTKLLLSLDPDNDPLAAKLLIDYYALRSEEYDYLIEFAETWDPQETLPNLRFSVALALYLKSKKKAHDSKSSTGGSDANDLQTIADDKLQATLLKFPNFLSPLFEANKIEPDAGFKKCDYFNYGPLETKIVPESIQVLIRLYVARTCMIWKTKEIMNWLERNATNLARRIANKELEPNDPNEYWSSVFKASAPRNLLRHLILSPDLPSDIVKVPPSAASVPILDIDPFPPQNQILSYTRPPRRANASSPFLRLTHVNPSTSSFRLFFRSMIPGFEAQGSSSELEADPLNIVINDDATEEGEGENSIHRSVNGIMDSLRGLLAAVQIRADYGDSDEDDEYDLHDID
ncbi:Transcription factor 25 [Fragariocoptes setiger]|uniref:Transcription factor 25 n=1 Tax=Fragariocoptes setiger TaxID=1670756 RepID=A0ABQ7S7L5_9ACAR|nr:Transcription factor 25 [Fragariocoptes setiger]